MRLLEFFVRIFMFVFALAVFFGLIAFGVINKETVEILFTICFIVGFMTLVNDFVSLIKDILNKLNTYKTNKN